MEFLPVKIFIFTLILTRVSAFFLVLPIFGAQAVPMQLKAGFVIILAVFFAVFLPVPLVINQPQPLEMILMLASEASCGLMFALIIVCIFSVIKIAGEIAEREMGLSLSEVLDPMTGENSKPVAMFLEMIFILFFLSAGGHHLVLRVLHKSFIIFTPGTFGNISIMADAVINAGSAMLIAALRLSAPILGAFMLLMITLAILARIAPEMNILFLSFPMKVALGFMMLTVFVPFLKDFVAEFADWMAKLLPL
ncbi:MAG: flagellar biosynthetic protein FliR [Phycisphaerae bacterium]|nr:flagellar biosynthetic protein FliR [Phycisphaerae bacterium]